MLKKIGLTFLGLLALTAVSYAGGAFQGYPLVGGDGASNCLSAGNNGVCNQYQPAGPSTLTGNETIPADTNIQGAGSNANPATLVFPTKLFGNSYGANVVSTTTGTTASVVIANGVLNQIYAGSAGATYTAVTLPSAPIANQTVCIVNSSASTLTLTAVNAATGYTINGTFANPATLTTGLTACWSLIGSGTVWYRTL